MANYDGSIKIDTKIDTGGFSSGIARMKSIASKGISAITTTLTAVSSAIIGCGTAAGKVGSLFESAMDKVSAISGAAGDDLAALTDKAKEMGATTKFSASESAEALQYMAMAGWKTEDMLEGISGVMSLSAADGLDLATTSDIVTDAITAFGLQAKDSSHFADVLAKASSSANTNVSMLGESFKYVAPLAGTMGYSVEDISIALGLMANASVKGSMAGTSLKTALANLSAPTKNMKEVMDKYKLSITDTNGQILPLIDVIKELREKFGGLSESEQTAAASTLFGKEAMSGMLAIINASDSDFTKLVDNINNADGAAKSMADTMQDNLQGQITILKSSLEGLGIELYQGMQEPLKEAAIEAQNYVNRLTGAFKDGGLTGIIEEAGNIFGELAVKAAEYAPKMVDSALSFLQSFVKGISANSDKLIESAKQIILTLIDGIVKFSADLAKSADKLINKFASAIVDAAPKVLDAFCEIITNILKALEKSIPVLLKKAVELVMKLAKTLINNAPKILKAAINLLSGIVKAIPDVIKKLVSKNGIPGLIKAIGEALRDGVPTIVSAGVELFGGLLKAIPQILVEIIKSIPELVGSIAKAIGDSVLGAIKSITSLFSGDLYNTNKLEEAKERLKKINEEIGESYNDIGGKVSDFLSGIEGAGSIFDNFNENILISSSKKQELEDNMNSVQSEITEICSRAAEERRSLTGGEIERLNELFQKMHELADQELAIEQQKQGVVTTQAEALNNASDISYEQYVQRAQMLSNTAEETRTAVIDKAYEQYTEELALLKWKLDNDETFSKREYDQQVQAAEDKYNQAVDAANKEAADTLAIISEGYLKRSDVITGYQHWFSAFDSAEEEEKRTHARNLKKIEEDAQKEYDELAKKTMSDRTRQARAGNIAAAKARAINEEEARHTTWIAENKNRKLKMLQDEDFQNQLAGFLSLVSLYETYSGKTLDCSEDIVKSFFIPMKDIPEETRTQFQNTMEGAIKGLKDKKLALYSEAEGIKNSVISIFKRGFEINSPSKVFKKIFKYNIEGAEGGLDEEAPKLFDKEDEIAQTFTKKMKVGISTEGLVEKLRAGIAAGKAFIAQALTAKVIHDVNINTEDANRKFVIKGDIISHLNIDGREFAVISAPYISEELAWMDGGIT